MSKLVNPVADQKVKRRKKRELRKVANIPVNKALYSRVKSEAKRKFAVYPSADANAWLVREYKKRGGTYRTGTKKRGKK